MKFLILFFVMFTLTSNAQINITTPSVHHALNFDNIHVSSNMNVVFKNTKSGRVSIIKTTTVNHPTKADAIAKFVETSDAYTLAVGENNITKTLSFTAKDGKPLVVNGKVATVKETYVIYVPKHMTIRKG